MRDYDPTLGRYVQADPLGLVDGASVYGYALQSPNRYTDPTGEAICGGACIAAGFFAAGLLYDYLTDEGCYSTGDFAVSVVTNLPPLKAAKAAGAG